MLQVLQAEFADVTISKIRFLEAEGLVTPARTASGYRKFSAADIERLRYVLTAQRDQYLPLKVIKEHLGAMDRGLRPTAGWPSGSACRSRSPPVCRCAEDFGADRHRAEADPRRSCASRRGSRADAARSSWRATTWWWPGGNHYDGDAILVAKAAAEFAPYGIEPRHLRPFRTAADREVGLIEQVAGPRRDDKTQELAALAVRLHAALVRSRLTR